jgi:thiol-disulfide isomerase/thioredoxin
MRGLGRVVLLLAVVSGCAPLQRGPAEGAKAPPTAGKDAEGHALTLNAYQGKVVLLSFWHSHCPPCKRFFQHEAELVERFAGRPFVLVGVNADQSADEMAKCQKAGKHNWPSFFDGIDGPIATACKVDRYPTLYLIDQKGVIRWRHVGLPADGEVEAKIDELIRKPVRE